MSDAADMAVSGTTNESAHCGTRWQLATHPSSPMCHASFVGGGRLAPPTLHGETKIFSTSPQRASTGAGRMLERAISEAENPGDPRTQPAHRAQKMGRSLGRPPRCNRERERERSTSGPEGFPELPCARARSSQGEGGLGVLLQFFGPLLCHQGLLETEAVDHPDLRNRSRTRCAGEPTLGFELLSMFASKVGPKLWQTSATSTKCPVEPMQILSEIDSNCVDTVLVHSCSKTELASTSGKLRWTMLSNPGRIGPRSSSTMVGRTRPGFVRIRSDFDQHQLKVGRHWPNLDELRRKRTPWRPALV